MEMNMNRERIVSYNLARLLKDIGFNEKTMFQVFENDSIETENEPIDWNSIDNKYSAPSLSTVSDWLLDNYNIFMDIEFISNNFDMGFKYKYIIIDVTKDEFEGNVIMSSFSRYKTKYAALENGIKAFLEKMKEKKKTIVLKNDNKIEIIA